MTTSEATLTMVLLFALRCLVPLVIMLGIGYAMNWLVDRWELEAAGEGKISATSMITPKVTKNSACWSIMKCDPEQRKNCPGFLQYPVPCWLAQTRAEGALPDKCVDCPLYHNQPSFA